MTPAGKSINVLSKIALEISRNGSRALAQKVETLKKQGKEVLHLASAPVDPPGPNVVEAAIAAIRENKRTTSRGLPELREAIAQKVLRENGIYCDPEREVLVTNGSMHGVFVCIAGCINPGDEVLMLAPCFYFFGSVQLMGGVCRFVQLDPAAGFRVDIQKIEREITPKTRVLIWNTPFNPSGYVATGDDTQAIAALAQKYNLTIISDESYEKWVFDGRNHISIGSLPEVRERALTVHSFSKSYSMAGWRVGYIVASGEKVEHLQKILEHTVLECNYVAQRATAAALSGPQDWVQGLTEKIRRHRDLVWEGLGSIEGVSFPLPQGGPNAFIDITSLTDSGQRFSDYALEEYGLPLVPGEAFMCPGHVRFSFAGEENQLEEAIRRFRSAVQRFPREGH
ncbi:MAG: aminotransferase class I/II-fold pyridoxal phosphate-dependent enzyme [Deltaproteobacteria bacterium]|nr:aminotransferase class I/II-fold pyridoxal phosphate-dependent enzyme [Deltaproteobacteria bacterium]